MAENSAIEWTDHTFNPWEGCQKVGPGCDHCYAETRNARFGGGMAINWGPGAPRRRTSISNWNKPLMWNKKPFYQCEGCGWRGHDVNLEGVTLFNGLPSCPECDDMRLNPVRPRVFCASLADVFDNQVPTEWRADLRALIRATPNLDWLLLTKRIGNVESMMYDAEEALPNVWLGATIVNQEEADRDIPKLLAVPAARRFLSMEPLLGLVDVSRWLEPTGVHCIDVCPDSSYISQNDVETVKNDRGEVEPICQHCGLVAAWTGYEDGIDWVIVGGESGSGARPMHPNWVRSLRDQCKSAGVSFLFKQWGEFHPAKDHDFNKTKCEMTPVAINIDGTIESRPLNSFALLYSEGWDGMCRIGKKASGRILDGRTWDEYPESAA